MKARSASVLFSMIALSVACSDLAEPVDPNSNGGAQGNAGRAGANGKSGGTGNGGGNAGAGKGSGGANGGGENGGDAGSAAEAVLSLDSVEAHVVGRAGNAVRFTVKGTQPSSGVYSIAVTFNDAEGLPVELFDGAFDSGPDTAEGRITFDTAVPLKETSFTAMATITGLADASKLSKVKVALVDGTDQLSDELEIDVGAQATAAADATCDPTNFKDRCEVGQSCTGTPPKCTAGVGPEIKEFKFLKGTKTLVLVRGVDPDDDMGVLHGELLDANNKPVTVDIDSAPTSTMQIGPAPLSSEGTFFGMSNPGLDFGKVTRIRMTPTDALGHAGPQVVANIQAPAKASDGLNCDARGFSGCLDTSVCSPGLPVISGRCIKLTNARTTECAAALKLDPEAGLTVAAGRMSGVSLWDPPSGCTFAENTGRPEGVISLHLASDVKNLTISTQRPETNIDTVLYLLAGCAQDVSEALGCNDDADGFASVLTLSDVPKGDYTIIVESGQPAGGSYGVSVSTQ